MGWTGPLTIDNLVEIGGIQGVGRFQNSLLATAKRRSDLSKKTQSILNGKRQRFCHSSATEGIVLLNRKMFHLI
jgi:hypothetical protein